MIRNATERTDAALEAALRAVERQGLRLHIRDLKSEIRDLEIALETGVDPYRHYAIDPNDREQRQRRLQVAKCELSDLVYEPAPAQVAIWEDRVERRGPASESETTERRAERAS